MTGTLDIAHIPGDGIGPEVTAAAIPIIEMAASGSGTNIRWARLDWGCDLYRRTGRMMPEDALEQLSECDAALFGAMGDPSVPDDVSAWGLRLSICQGLDQYVCERPAWSIDGVHGPLHGRAFDLVIVRENSQGEYSGIGGRIENRTEDVAIESAVFTRVGVRRVAEYACTLAAARRGKLTSITKSNVLRHSMRMWDENVEAVAREHPAVEYETMYVDAAASQLILEPEAFDVVLASNAHGDILSDLTGALMGSLGMAGSGNLDPAGEAPAMFEPAHGSAPDLVGRGIANPIGTVRAGAMMLKHCGLHDAAERIHRAVAAALRSGTCTPDMGGTARTADVSDAVLHLLANEREASGTPSL